MSSRKCFVLRFLVLGTRPKSNVMRFLRKKRGEGEAEQTARMTILNGIQLDAQAAPSVC